MKIEHEVMSRIIHGGHLAVIPNYYFGHWECDLLAVSNRGYTTEYEIKTTKADFLKDFDKTKSLYKKTVVKHDEIKEGRRTNRFYFVIPKGLEVDIPDYAGCYEYTVTNWGGFYMNRVKAPKRLHNRKVSDQFIKRLTTKLSWRYYRILLKFAYPDLWSN